MIVNSPGPRLCSQVSCCEAARCGMRGVICTEPTEILRGKDLQNAEGASAHGDDEQLVL